MRLTRVILEHLILLTLGASISLASPLPPSVAPSVFAGFSGSVTPLLKRNRKNSRSDDLSEDGVTVDGHPVENFDQFRKKVDTHGADNVHVDGGGYSARLIVNE
jgi:hypothetical protein